MRRPASPGASRARTRHAATYKVIKPGKDRWWKVRDPWGALVCARVYRRGAAEVVSRLAA